mmetsp:Transcript_66238/g.182934  ORF Transcript_66238/g.182934 Transcript_66238/m.182934 type:complete len:143 (-) Transcript_66238:208-636(-)
MVKSTKDEPMVHNGFKLPFTARKVSLDILDACNTRIANLSRDPDFNGLFVHGGPEVPAHDFLQSSVAVMRNLADNVLKPAEELGLPFITMVDQLEASGKKQMKFKSGPEGVEYVAKDDTINSVYDSVKVLSDKFEAMELDPR